MTVIALIVSCTCLVSAVLAAVPAAGTPEVQAQSVATAVTGTQANADQPVAAESSYGYGRSGYQNRYYGSNQNYNSYAPKYDSYGSNYNSYNNYDSYSTPYITGSCYGQYPGVTGNANYDCKSYSVCQADGRLDILYCPPYTRFNNYLGVCDWHFKVDSYCNPLYKEEYYGNNNYGSSYNSYGSSYNSYEKPSYSSHDSYSNYGKSSYNNYEYPRQEYGYEQKSYDYPSYGHRSSYSYKKY